MGRSLALNRHKWMLDDILYAFDSPQDVPRGRRRVQQQMRRSLGPTKIVAAIERLDEADRRIAAGAWEPDLFQFNEEQP